jgi:predicted DsbA family dithiol-disulfide isomerase
MGNTFDAHRLIHLASERGMQDQAVERLFRAYFTEGRPVFDQADLTGLAADSGLDPAEAGKALADGSYADAVRADEQQAAELGISGVPFFVLDGRYAVSGAQPASTFSLALERAFTE